VRQSLEFRGEEDPVAVVVGVGYKEGDTTIACGVKCPYRHVG